MSYENEILLMIVSYMGYFNIVKELIKVGVDVNFNDGDKIFLIVVCYCLYINIVGELIKEGVVINLMDKEKMLLIIVCYMGNWILV